MVSGDNRIAAARAHPIQTRVRTTYQQRGRGRQRAPNQSVTVIHTLGVRVRTHLRALSHTRPSVCFTAMCHRRSELHLTIAGTTLNFKVERYYTVPYTRFKLAQSSLISLIS
ncbi:hypothetical protein EVAR_79148_1 [Eumeta japonica]|uniref:Uncharacterized protein n=1 Tax=Eumeta variegata TaxID=151549 RepID=A0A4C1UTG4_EUMVA|nr:hypothetical protein EVAR_79148_1 [Eumeta japonica]